MKVLELHHSAETNLFHPATPEDLLLLQHFMNEDIIGVTERGLEKVRHIAEFHDCKVGVTEVP